MLDFYKILCIFWDSFATFAISLILLFFINSPEDRNSPPRGKVIMDFVW